MGLQVQGERMGGGGGRLDRHSRASGNLAVACQDCGIIRQYRRDSRLRGNDGREAGSTVERRRV